MPGFRRSSFYRATNMQGKMAGFRRASFIAPQTRRWKMPGFRRASFCRATNVQGKMAGFMRAAFYRATHARMVRGSLPTRLFFFFLASQTLRWKMAPCGRKAKPTRLHLDCTVRTVRVPVALDPETCQTMQQVFDRCRSVCCGGVLPDTKVVVVNRGTNILPVWRQLALLRTVTTCRIYHWN